VVETTALVLAELEVATAAVVVAVATTKIDNENGGSSDGVGRVV
jgi:hypothetical protein